MRKTILFTECEHNGDLQNYIEDLEFSGADIILSEVNSSEEEGTVIIEITDFENFKGRFKLTDSYDFASIF
jgi:hypothetical protein